MSIINFIRRHLGDDPKVLFEFGFYDGEDSISYKNNFPKCEVYSFEPDISNFNLHKNALIKKGIHVYNYAISNKGGLLDFYPRIFTKEISGKPKGFHSPGSGILPVAPNAKKEWGSFQRFDEPPVKVESTTISDFCNHLNIKRIDFMHIDVEGALKEVLEGFGDIRPILIKAETGVWQSYEGSISLEDAHKMFRQMGYKILSIKEENTFLRYMGD